jgi:hypothetical protein
MDETYHRFRTIMKLVEEYPNDMELGEAVRSYYWTEWKKVSDNHLTPPTNPNQLDLFDEDIENVARLGED